MSPKILVFSTTYKTRVALEKPCKWVKESVIGQLKDSRRISSVASAAGTSRRSLRKSPDSPMPPRHERIINVQHNSIKTMQRNENAAWSARSCWGHTDPSGPPDDYYSLRSPSICRTRA